MASVHDVAKYILQKKGEMSSMKLQKLLYYSQVWSVVWDEDPLFRERIEAWANGPVIREVYDVHRGRFKVADWPCGDPGTLSKSQIETIDSVLEFYGDKSAQWLSDLSHREKPWVEARIGIPEGERSEREITVAALDEYYSGLS